MKDNTGGEAFSYSDFNRFYDDPGDPEAKARGGFGDGELILENTDKMVNGYYFQDANLKAAAAAAGMTPEQVEKIGFGNGTEAEVARAAASAKAMPLSALVTSTDETLGKSNRIYFGIIASAAGFYTIDDDSHKIGSAQPLPGGLQLALIAGLFGLGFWYIRRRKTTVA